MNKKKHILIITSGFAKDEADSTCIPALQIFVKELSNYFNISIITLHFPFSKTPYHWNSLPVFPCHAKGFFKRFLIFSRAYFRFFKIHQKTPVDLIHSFWLADTAWIGQRLSRRKNVPHLVSFMGQDAKKENKYLKRLNLNNLNFITQSAFQTEVLHQNTGIQSQTIIPFGVAEEDTMPSVKKDIDVIGVGNLTELKDFHTFIKTIQKTQIYKKNIRAYIVGDGPEREKLEAQSKAAGLEHHIHFTGKISRQKTLELIARSQVLLHPSTYESFGMIFPEALANQTRIISRKVGVAEEGTHWKIGNNAEEFSKAVLHFLNNPTIEKIQNPYTIRKTVEQYIKYYKTLFL